MSDVIPQCIRKSTDPISGWYFDSKLWEQCELDLIQSNQMLNQNKEYFTFLVDFKPTSVAKTYFI